MPYEDLRTSNRRKNIEEFESRSTCLESLPQVIFVELTENCNLSCPMCRSSGPFRRDRNMSDELFTRVAEELFPTAEIVDLRGWGESTIRRDFPRFVEEALDYGCRLRLVTNLTLRNEALWRRLVSAGSLIAVSFDASDARTFAAVRGGAKLDVVLRNLEILADEAERSGVGTELIHLNVVVQSPALGELSGIIETAARLGLRVQLNPVTLANDDPQNLAFHKDTLNDELARAVTMATDAGVEVQLNAVLYPESGQDAHTNKTCTHPWMYSYVNYRGQVGFCDHLIGAPAEQHLIGDLTTSSFAEIWNGPTYQRLRFEHARGRDFLSPWFDECRWCYFNRYVDFDDVSYPPYVAHKQILTGGRCVGFTPRETTGA
ncbi:radical SAM protein [Nonomuraea sp. MG754425]|uniref:radical SAM protein n=1 Tax=Nonomuraea sp. MG754425 TaxID=2570319 RepID=UPI001F223254|nr:radical SAM protein [Nonomuraea sp. MG754425]MCF6473396.1 radical SAM protein [Nonomuraea sp. MG754425]